MKDSETHILFPAASHVEPKGGRIDRIAPMTYWIIWISPDGTSRYLHGIGGERSTQVMLARGLNRAIEMVSLNATDPDHVAIECVTETLQFWKTPDELLFDWFRENRMAQDSVEIWTTLAAFSTLANLTPRLAKNPAEGTHIRTAKQRAKALTADALAQFRIKPELYREPGVYFTDEQKTRAA